MAEKTYKIFHLANEKFFYTKTNYIKQHDRASLISPLAPTIAKVFCLRSYEKNITI